MSSQTPTKSAVDMVEEDRARAIQPTQLLSSKEAATYLNVSVAFLERDRWAGKREGGNGPLIPYVVIGNRAVRYKRSDLDAHIEKNIKS